MIEFFAFAADQWLLFTLMISLVIVLIVSEMAGRIPALGSAAATALINTGNALVLDLRPPGEYGIGHIAGAIQVGPSDTPGFLKSKGVPLDQYLLLVCANGHSSRSLGNSLRRQGYQRVRILAGGVGGWRMDNMPLVRKSEAKKEKTSALKASKGTGKARKGKQKPAAPAAG